MLGVSTSLVSGAVLGSALHGNLFSAILILDLFIGLVVLFSFFVSRVLKRLL